jgi:hypothetical protein
LADGEGRSRVNPVVPGDGADADAVDLSAFKVALPRPARDVRLAGEACVLAWLEGREQLGVRSHALRLWGEATEQSPKVGVRVVRTVAAVENIMRCLDHLLTAAGRGAMGECLQPGFPLARLTHAVLRWLSVILDEFEIYTREHTFDGEPWGAAGRSFAEYSAAYVLASIRPTLDGLSEWTSKEPLDSRETPTAYPRKPSDARMAALWLEDALVHMDGELRISMT